MPNKKIDLHIHTRGRANREISPQDLVSKLLEAEVGLASITDHDEFDELFFNSSNQLAGGRIAFIPGIELTVSVEGTNKHIILYSDDVKTIKMFSTLERGVAFEVFKETLEDVKHKIVISPHFQKQESASWTDVDQLLIDFSFAKRNKFLELICEAPSKDRANLLLPTMGGKIHITSFSDVADWSQYIANDVPTLPTFDMELNSLAEYIHYVTFHKKSGFNTEVDTSTEITYERREDGTTETISIPKGLTIVFGEKGSGKTHLLDKIKEHNKADFTKLSISNSEEVKGLNDLYEFFVKSKAISLEDKKILKSWAGALNKVYPTTVRVDNFAFDSKAFRANFDLYNRNSRSVALRNELAILKEVIDNNQSTIIKKKKMFADLSVKLDEVIQIINDPLYSGSIGNEDIEEIVAKNREDLKRLSIFNGYRFNELFKNEISLVFQSTEEPKIGLVDIALDIKNFFDDYESKRQLMISNITELKNNIDLFKSGVLGDSYLFSAKVIKRANRDSSKNDFAEIQEANQTISSTELERFMKEIKFDDIYKNRSFNEYKIGDALNIMFYSKFGASDNYLPSTGQLDMLKLDANLKKGKNLIIDEFCNTLDNKYVYENLIDIVSNYKGVIIASTHNPIISVIARVGKYFYTERDGNNYRIYESNKSIFDKLLEEGGMQHNTKQKLLDVIEGTKQAFEVRGEKYES